MSFTTSLKRPIFPFTAIIGQDEMKLALLLNVIDPKIGGVIIMGDRGTGKSTTIRAVADLLPQILVIKDDPFNSDPYIYKAHNEVQNSTLEKNFMTELINVPMIDLPLGATEDRVCGTIDMEKALTEGVKSFEPGLLAKANRGILYVDEVNLLDDHLVDILLDAAASGWNTVEREGISVRHPSQFVLVGSGNPEEGELRPQLLDRFGMHAEIKTVKDPLLRVEIVEQRSAFDRDALECLQNHQVSQDKLKHQIIVAQKNLSNIVIDYSLRVKISEICSELNVDGLRGDIVINRASKALAAYRNKIAVDVHDIKEVIKPCLRHRLRKDPLDAVDSGAKIDLIVSRVLL